MPPRFSFAHLANPFAAHSNQLYPRPLRLGCWNSWGDTQGGKVRAVCKATFDAPPVPRFFLFLDPEGHRALSLSSSFTPLTHR